MAMAAPAVADAVGAAVGRHTPNPAVRLAVGILLFYVAGVLFFIAFGRGASYVESFETGGGLRALAKVFTKMFTNAGDDVAGATGGSTTGGVTLA